MWDPVLVRFVLDFYSCNVVECQYNHLKKAHRTGLEYRTAKMNAMALKKNTGAVFFWRLSSVCSDHGKRSKGRCRTRFAQRE
jgi:hypothetical protein